MAKIIAVCGSPSSGKTTTALKLAQEIYFSAKCPVLFISPDTNTPTLSYLFPRSKDNELFSLGAALDKTSITAEDILKQTVNINSMKDFGFLGLKLGENKYSYARPTEEKVKEFFVSCGNIASFVFIDCASYFDDPISEMAMRESGIIVQMITADLKCMGYYSAYEDRYNALSDKVIKILNVMDNDILLPIDEVKQHFNGTDFMLPYSIKIKEQAIIGSLTDKTSDSKYKSVCTNVVRRVMSR